MTVNQKTIVMVDSIYIDFDEIKQDRKKLTPKVAK